MKEEYWVTTGTWEGYYFTYTYLNE